MKVKIKNWIFCPRLITSLLTLVFFILFMLLGFWQLERAEYKHNQYSFFEKRQAKQPLDLNASLVKNFKLDDLIWRKVAIKGRFIEKHQIVLDNRVNAGKAGYYIYTPFRIEDTEKVVLVNRGWVSSNNNRTSKLNLTRTYGNVKINGVVKKEPRTGILLSKDHTEKLDETTVRLQRLDIEEASDVIGVDLLPFIVRLAPNSDYGYVRKWKTNDSGEDVHLGYAYQWFAFAITLLIIYLIINTKREDGAV